MQGKWARNNLEEHNLRGLQLVNQILRAESIADSFYCY